MILLVFVCLDKRFSSLLRFWGDIASKARCVSLCFGMTALGLTFLSFSLIGLGELAFAFVPFFGAMSHTPLSVL